MPNFNYSGPRIMPDTSKIDQAAQQSFQQMANIEIDRYRRRQAMIARAMDFINIEVPETALQDQKALADKHTTFKQYAVQVFKSAADQNRELNFDESAELAKRKSALLKEAQAYNMYHQLLTHATNAYIADPEKYEEEFLTDISAIDFGKSVEERTNPMTILAANIYQPGVDLDAFEKSVGTADKFYVTNNKGDKTLDEQELMNNVQRQLSTDKRFFKRGVRGGQWTNFDEASQFMFNYIKDKFTDVKAYHRPVTNSGNKTEIPTNYVQAQDFNYGSSNYSFVTALDVQKAGPTIINGKTQIPVSIGFLPTSTEDIELKIPRPKDFQDPYGIFDWSAERLKIKVGDVLPMEVINQVGGYEFKPYVTYRGPKYESDGKTIKRDDNGNIVMEDEALHLAKYDDKVKASFGQGTNTKDAYNYIKAYEENPDLLNKAADQWKTTKGVTGDQIGVETDWQGRPVKGQQQSQSTGKQQAGSLSSVGLDDVTAKTILGDNLKTLQDNGYVTVNKDGTMVLSFDNQAQYDAFVALAKSKGYIIK